MSGMNDKLLDQLEERFEKQSFVPMGAEGAAAPPPMDPAGGAAMALPPGMPPMDPQMMGGAPPGMPPMPGGDPAAMGMDPAAMGGAPAEGGEQVSVSMDDLRRMVQEMGGATAGSDPAAPAPAGADVKGRKVQPEELSNKLDALSTRFDQLIGALTGGEMGVQPAPPPDALAGADGSMAAPPEETAPAPPLDEMMGAPKAANLNDAVSRSVAGIAARLRAKLQQE